MGLHPHDAGGGYRTRCRLVAVLLFCSLGAWLTLAQSQEAGPPRPPVQEYSFHHDHILGTSLDLWVVAPEEAAASACEQAILGEIERLRLIFSTFDPQSEISRLNRTSGPVVVSREMVEVLRLYEVFQQKSKGAFNGQLGQLVAVWKEAEKAGKEPDAAVLGGLVRQINRPGWQIDAEHQTVTRLTDQPLNLNSIGKGYIIQQALAAARSAVPSVRGLLINLGGDMVAWGNDVQGRVKWVVGVQDPFHPEDNAPVLTAVELENRAIATSGGYERFYTINGKRYSHLFDPRTGRPTTGVASATVVARDNVTANALATTLCVLTPEEGLQLVAATPGAECFLVSDDGKQFRSKGMNALEVALPRPAMQPAEMAQQPDGEAWPAGFEVSITTALPNLGNVPRGYRKPYVAVWVENAEGKALRTLAVWGNNSKYLKDLTNWWALSRNDNALIKAVTRATRAPGKYTLVWDGKDTKGKVMPQGTYVVKVEVHREHGKHTLQTGKIACRAEPATVTMDKNAETEATVVTYGKK